MKPTIKGHNYTKFSYRERSSLLSHSSLEYMYFKGRTEVEVGDLIFCREIFPYLESSLGVLYEVLTDDLCLARGQEEMEGLRAHHSGRDPTQTLLRELHSGRDR